MSKEDGGPRPTTLTYYGVDIETMGREQLIEALKLAAEEINQLRDTAHRARMSEVESWKLLAARRDAK